MSETKQVSVVDQLKSSVKLMESQFKTALPSHINPDKFIRVVHTAIQTNKDLVESDRTSFFAACMKLAQEGLLPDNREAALVTFKTKDGTKMVQAMPMVAGILKKVRNSGELSSITSQLVYKNDLFKYWVDTDGEHLKHEPQLFGDRGELVGVYALAKMKDDSVYIEVMTMEQIEAIKKSSRSSQYGPWAGPFATEMARKSVIRRLSKRLPLSTDIESTIKADDDFYEFEETKDQPQAEQDKPKASSRLKNLIEENQEIKDVTPPAPQSETVKIETL